MHAHKSVTRPTFVLARGPSPITHAPPIPANYAKSESRRFGLCAVLTLLGYGTFVAACSYLLVSFTAAALGGELLGWSQASLLELGALVLSVVRPNSRFKNLTCKLTSASLLILTLALIHGTSQGSFDRTSRQESAYQVNLQNLQDQHGALKQQLSLIPLTHLTRRQVILDQLDAQTQVIAAALTQLTSSQNLTTLTSRHYTEFALRVALVLMNLLFASLLVEKWRQGQGAQSLTEKSPARSLQQERLAPRLSLVKTGGLALAFSILFTFGVIFSSPPNFYAPLPSSLGGAL